MMGPSHVVPGQEAGNQGHTSSQNELQAGLTQHSQGCSEGAAAALQGTCVVAPTGDIASVGNTDTTHPGRRGRVQHRQDLPLSGLAA